MAVASLGFVLVINAFLLHHLEGGEACSSVLQVFSSIVVDFYNRICFSSVL